MQIDYAGVEATRLFEFGDRDRGAIGVDFQDLVSGEPAGKVEIVRGGVVEQGAVGFHLAGSGGRGLLVAANGFEDYNLADLAGFDARCGRPRREDRSGAYVRPGA